VCRKPSYHVIRTILNGVVYEICSSMVKSLNLPWSCLLVP